VTLSPADILGGDYGIVYLSIVPSDYCESLVVRVA
jgi:hypothetical protein